MQCSAVKILEPTQSDFIHHHLKYSKKIIALFSTRFVSTTVATKNITPLKSDCTIRSENQIKHRHFFAGQNQDFMKLLLHESSTLKAIPCSFCITKKIKLFAICLKNLERPNITFLSVLRLFLFQKYHEYTHCTTSEMIVAIWWDITKSHSIESINETQKKMPDLTGK